MPVGEIAHPQDERERRDHALAAAGIVGTWEWDHRRAVTRYCRDAAALLAGNADLAGCDLGPDEALANVFTDDVAWVRTQMRGAACAPGVVIREHRVRSGQHGVRRVLCRGRTYHDATGRATVTTGIVIDITEIEADGHERFGAEMGDALDRAAEHGVAAYEAIEATGLPHLLQPARMFLLAIGREIARSLTRRSRLPH